MRKFIGALGCASALALVSGATAMAAPPEKFGETTVRENETDVCGFPIAVTSTVMYFSSTVTFPSGKQRATLHATEVDEFTANGVTLTSDRYTYNLQLYGENYVISEEDASGVVVRVPLPDGTVFFSAGRTAPLTGFALTPDVGRSGDVAAFCAAFSSG
jgi:hypothetical protein